MLAQLRSLAGNTDDAAVQGIAPMTATLVKSSRAAVRDVSETKASTWGTQSTMVLMTSMRFNRSLALCSYNTPNCKAHKL